MTPFRLVSLTAMLLLMSAPVLAAIGGGCNGRCDHPYPNELPILDGFGTSSEASSRCAERFASRTDLSETAGGYVIKWVGDPPDAGQEQGYFCYACLSSPYPQDGDDFMNGRPIGFARAGWIALEAYPGAISAIDFFTGENEGVAASYDVTVVDASQGRAAVVRIDSSSGIATLVEETSTTSQ